MVAFNRIVQPKTTSGDREATKKLAAHQSTGVKQGKSLTPPSNGSSLGTKVSGGANLSGGRG